MSDTPSVRRQSRELALQVLFQQEFSKELSPTQSLENFKSSFHMSEAVWEFASSLLQGVMENTEKIDGMINSLSDNWSTERMSLVDLNILRVSVFELKFSQETPHKAVINEAIEISKKYGGTDSHQFINGLLGQLVES